MAQDIATLALKIENGDVLKATTALNSLTVAGGKSEAAASRLTRRMALLEIEARQMDAAVGKGSSAFARMASSMGVTQAAASGLAKVVGVLSAGTAIGFFGREFLTQSIDAQNALAQLEAAVKSTGGVAGRTVADLDAYSMALQQTTTYSDEAVKGAQAMLLTFDKIRGANFDRATQAVADLATRLGGDLQGAAVQVGKALQDPTTGLTALRRSGVSFSASQIQVIKDLYETGKAAEGQRIILKELEHQFGGSAAAARQTLGGALTGLKNDFGDLFERTKEETGALVGFINATGETIRELHNYADAAKAVALALGSVAVALAAATLAGKSFALQAVLGGAATAAEGLAAALTGVGAAGTLALGPIALLATAGALAIYDLNKAFDDYDAGVEEASKNTKEYVDYLKALGRAQAHAPKKVLPADTVDITDEMRKFAALVDERKQELGKLTALNKAYRESDVALKILGITYDAHIQKAKDAKEHHGAQLATLNRLTDGITKQKIVQVQLNDQLEREAHLRATQRTNADQVRTAQQQLELARLNALPNGGDAAAARAVEQERENGLYKARLDFAEKTLRATDAQTEAARREYEDTVRTVEATHQLAVETMAVNRAAEQRRALASGIEGAITDVSEGRNPLIRLVAGFKQALIHALSEAFAEKVLASKFATMLGLGADGAAPKQLAAGGVMLQAATLQMAAANAMLAAKGMPATSGAGSNTTQSTPGGMSPAQQKALGYAGVAFGSAQAGYGVGSGLYSSSHGAAGNYARGAVGGAAAGALTGAAIGSVVPVIGTAVGAAVGAIVGFTAGLFGVASAAKASAVQVRAMREALASTMEGLRAEVSKDATASAMAQIHAQSAAIRKQIEDAFSGGGADSDTVRERNKQLAELNSLEAERVRQLKEEAAAIIRQAQEDLDVRTLRNKGLQHEADVQQKINEDAREYAAAVEKHMSAEYLAQLKMNQAIEEAAVAAGTSANAISAFTTAVRNAPTGFKLASYIQQFGAGASLPTSTTGRAFDTRPSLPLSSPALTSTSASPAGVSVSGGITIIVNESKTPEITKAAVASLFLASLDDVKSGTGGINTTRAQALEVMKAPMTALRS